MVVSGRLKMLGNSTWANEMCKLTVLEIGDRTFRNVRVSAYLHNYLAVGEDLEILLCSTLTGLAIVGVRRAGQTYVEPMNTTIIVGFCVVFGLLTLFTFVVPLLMAYVAYKTVSVSGEIRAFQQGSARSGT